jgi:hypothetical protein
MKLGLVPGNHFQPSLMFVGKAGAYPSEALFALPANIILGWKTCQEQTLELNKRSRNLRP